MDRYNAKMSAEVQLSPNWSTGFNGNFVTSKIKKQSTANSGVTATIYNAPVSYNMKGIPSHVEGDRTSRTRTARHGSTTPTGLWTTICSPNARNVSSETHS